MSKQGKLKAKAAEDDQRPAPSEKDRQKSEAAIDRIIAATDARTAERSGLPRLGATWDGDCMSVGPKHNDSLGWSAQLVEALGVVDPRVASFLLTSATNGGWGPKPQDEESAKRAVAASEEALAFVAEIQPTSAIEAALALQMAAAHTAAMTLARHQARADIVPVLAEHSKMMNQTMRTFTAQVEALSKLRTGGKQQVEVRYVYVDARTQTVVNGRGQGGDLPNSTQPHAPGTTGLPFAPGLPMWGANPRGDSLRVASDQGAEAMPDARGPEPRRTEGRGERKLRLRTVDGRDRAGPVDGQGDGEAVPEHAA